MPRIPVSAALAIVAVMTGACVSHDDASSGAVRMLNAVPDAPRMNLLVNDTLVASQVDYRLATPFIIRRAGTYDLAVEEIIPGGNAVVVDLPDVSLAVNEELSLLIVGKVVEGTVEALQLTSTTRGVTTGQTRLRIVHAAPDVPQLDVYITEPDAVLSAVAPLDTLRFRQRTDETEFRSGAGRIRFTPRGDPATVYFDSGALNLPRELDLLVVIVAGVGPGVDRAGAVPLQLVVLSNSTSASSLSRDKDALAELRIVNASPDSYPLDVVLDPGTEDDVTLATGLAFPETAPGPAAYTELPPDTYGFTVSRTGDSETVALEFSAAAEGGTSTTYVLSDLIEELNRIAAPDDPRRVATEGRLRLVHASPAAGSVDVYVAEPGADLEDETADFRSVPFGASTGYLSLEAGSYDLTLTVAGSKTNIRLTREITVENSGIYAAVLSDKAGGGRPVELILLDDLAAP